MLTVVERFAVGLGAVSLRGVTCGRGVSGGEARHGRGNGRHSRRGNGRAWPPARRADRW